MDDADGQALFDAVRTGLTQKKDKKKKDVEEEIDLWMVAPKLDPRGLRENYFRKNIFNIGDMVESLKVLQPSTMETCIILMRLRQYLQDLVRMMQKV